MHTDPRSVFLWLMGMILVRLRRPPPPAVVGDFIVEELELWLPEWCEPSPEVQ
jgi:hypothetical protein